MSNTRSFYNQPVRSLQHMLRTIALNGGDIDLLIPNGVYDPQTQAAVSQFQRSHGLPVTGVADRKTWAEIVRAYDASLVMVSPAQSITFDLQLDFPPDSTVYSPLVHLAQCMLHLLAEVYSSVFKPEQSGRMDEITRESLRNFQQLSGLPMTGNLDKQTWKHLALHYSAAAARSGSR